MFRHPYSDLSEDQVKSCQLWADIGNQYDYSPSCSYIEENINMYYNIYLMDFKNIDISLKKQKN